MALAVAGVSSALAHANLVRSEPAAGAVLDESPPALRLWFSEPPELRFSEVRLLDRTGQRVEAVNSLRIDPADSAIVAPLQPLPPGIYAVTWRVLSSVDGHVTAGAFAFAIGRDQVPPDGLPSVSGGTVSPSLTAGPGGPGVVVRWLGYLAMAAMVGAFGFFPLVARPAVTPAHRRARPTPAPRRAHSTTRAGLSDQAALQAESSDLHRPLLAIATAGVALAVASSLVAALLQAATSAGVGVLDALGGPLEALLGGTRYGLLLWLRLALLAGIGTLLWIGGRRFARDRRAPAGWWWWIGFALSLLVLLTASLGSHAAAHPDGVLAVAADWLHLAAVSLWIGGLAALAPALWRLGRPGPALAHGAARLIVARFSQVAIVCVAIVVATGTYRAVREVADWENLWDTPYGTALLAKLGLTALILALAGSNLLLVRRWARPSEPTLRGKAEPVAGDEGAIQEAPRIRRVVGGEILLAGAILLVTGVLTALPPGREAFGSGLIVRGQADDLRLVLRVSPGEPGINTFDVYVRERAGRPVLDAEKVAIVFTMVEHDMGEAEAVATPAGDGHYVAHGGYVPMSGTWRARVLVRRPGLDDARATLVLQPREGPVAARVASAPTPGQSTAFQLLLGADLMALAVFLWLASRRLRKQAPWARPVGIVVGLMLAVAGGYVVLAAIVAWAPSSRAVANPIPADATSLARGQQIYQTQCAACHGPQGRGDGPLARTLRPRPVDLSQHVGTHSDGELFNWISNGVPGTAMPVFKDQLSEEDRWHALNYIKTFAPVER